MELVNKIRKEKGLKKLPDSRFKDPPYYLSNIPATSMINLITLFKSIRFISLLLNHAHD